MKIGDIIKQTLIERRIISEDEPAQQVRSGQETRAYNLDNPQEVLDAALANGCATQWGVKPNQLRANVKVDRNYTISGDSGTIVVPKGTRAHQDGENGDYFIGNKISEDPNNTYFWGFGTDGQSFRWVCNALRSVDQSGTRSLTPAQDLALKGFLKTYGSVYTKMGGEGKTAKDVRELEYPDGRPVFDKSTGIPPEGNYVYVQDRLYNIKPNQLAGVAKDLQLSGWTLTQPLVNTPEYNYRRRMIDLFPELKNFGLTQDVMVYPIKASQLQNVVADKRFGGVKMSKEVCGPPIKFLKKCMDTSGGYAGCDDPNKINDNKYTAARCYTSTQKNPQFKGILGLGDELQSLYDSPDKFGIGKEVTQLQKIEGNVDERPLTRVNEGSLVFTIKNHLLENIRNKNSQL
jgi:hypothetical protein